MTFLIILLVVVVVAALVVLLVLRNRSVGSSVDSFRRHIDALGPEARRTVVDQVQSAAGRGEDAADDTDLDAPAATDDPGDEGGARGT